jgi:HPt (histidine-containing phosphotransfer) domain-containing protein
MERLVDRASKKELDKVVEIAHTIKGASYSVGAIKVGDEAYAIELSGKSNDVFSVKERIEKLETAVSKTKLEIKRYLI